MQVYTNVKIIVQFILLIKIVCVIYFIYSRSIAYSFYRYRLGNFFES